MAFALTPVIALSADRAGLLSGRLWSRPFQEALVFLAAIFVPASYSFFHFWPGWSWLYFVDPDASSPAWPVLAFLGIFAAGLAGYVLAHALLVRRRRGLVYAAQAVAVAGVLAIALAAGDRFTSIRNIDEFTAGQTRRIWEVAPLAAHFGVVFVFVGMALATILHGHRRQRREGR